MTSARDTFTDVWDGVRSQPARVGLAFLALFVGVTALTLLLAVLTGLEERSQRIVRELGVNVFGILPGGGEDGRAGARLREEHLELLRGSLPGAAVAGVRLYDVPTPGTGRDVRLVATDPDLLAVRRWPLAAGRFLDAEDLRGRARCVVVSGALSRQWNWQPGDRIVLRDTPFDVVGVVENGGGALDGESADTRLTLGERSVFVPATTPAHWATFGQEKETCDAVYVQVPDPARYAGTLAAARRLLDQAGLRPGALAWLTPDTLLRGIRRLQNTIKVTVGSIALLCLVLGGTTLMSLMVANVRDRVGEIGLRRSLGATARDIAALFVLEACLVTVSAAASATLATHAVLAVLRARLPVPVGTGAATWLLPLGAAAALGMVFAYWPARYAATIAPSEALRNE